MRNVFIVAALVGVTGCGPSDTVDESTTPEPAEEPTAFDPLVQSLERAQSVQETVDAQAAAQRRAIEEAER